MDNQKVRQHLRKGEQAVTLLESLGYRYDQKTFAPSEWIAPPEKKAEKTPEQEKLEKIAAFLKQLDVADKKPAKPNVGDIFRISGTLPAGHKLRGTFYHGQTRRVTAVIEVLPGSEHAARCSYVGTAVQFQHPTFGVMWVPEENVVVVSHAHF